MNFEGDFVQVNTQLGFESDQKRQRLNDQVKKRRPSGVRRDCPYLDTVNRQVLDFDFEPRSTSNFNLLYACLVCGKYFQGKGRNTPAYSHSLDSVEEAGHHVFLNIATERFYCLPEGYEISDPSLEDIRLVLNPRFNQEQIEQINLHKQWSRAIDGSHYIPGMVGLNNINANSDFVNVVVQCLMRVTPLRDFFLEPKNYLGCKSKLVHRFGELTRKIWNPKNFKGHVSPLEFLQAVVDASEKQFQLGLQADPVKFMSWILQALHGDLIRDNPNKNGGSSIIYECFEVELEVVDEETNKTSRLKSLMLELDLPPPPLFMDVIPQVQLSDVLRKFDGETVTEVVRPKMARMRYRVTRLPRYLILHMQRFADNSFFVEKNPTLVVDFPLRNLDLRDYIPLPMAQENVRLPSMYDLIGNVVHDGNHNEGSYRVFVQRKSDDLWYQMQDLRVSEALPQVVALSEAYMQIYEQQQ